MAITSQDSFIAALGAGQRFPQICNKITGLAAYAAGRWYDLSTLNGYPVANTYAGAALNAAQLTDLSVGGTYHGGNVAALIKHLVRMAAFSVTATWNPATFLLCDFLMYYPGINLNSAALQNFVNGVALPRYANGLGVRACLVCTSSGAGAGAPTLTLPYLDEGGNPSNLPVTVAIAGAAVTPHILHSGILANNYGPFLPLAAGDLGMTQATSIQLSAGIGVAGTGCLLLCKPLAEVPISTAGYPGEREFMNQVAALPRIYDGAFLGVLAFTGGAVAASSQMCYEFDAVWG